MPRTTYSDFSLPNLEQDSDHQKRECPKRKVQIQKKRSRNFVHPNRKTLRTSKKPLKNRQGSTRGYSPDHKIQTYDQDSASFHSDCIDNRLDSDHAAFDRTQETLPFLDKDCELAINRLVEESEKRQLVEIMEDCRLWDKDDGMIG